MRSALLLFLCTLTCMPIAAVAQQEPQPQAPMSPSPDAATTPALLKQPRARAKTWSSESDHWRYEGDFEADLGNGSKLFADVGDIYLDKATIVALGNVSLISPEGQISAERMEFDLRKGTATFYRAQGVMGLGAQADPRQFATQEADIYFHGEKVEKLSPRKYRITRGAFTTCVQPEPRWKLVSQTADINLNDYAVARNTMLKVKGVPVLFLPWVYYPMQDDQRATGFLLPTYGNSTLRGQAISNEFFWAIGRSHDATFEHNWFTKAGQGFGAEYRFVPALQSSGTLRYFHFRQREATYERDGFVTRLPSATSQQFTGTVSHALGRSLRARGRVDYASDIVSQQLYQQNLSRATNPTRAVEGGLSGNWGALSASAVYQRTEVFSSIDRSFLYGGTPRVSASLAPQRMFGLPVYGAVNGSYEYLPYRDQANGVVRDDRSLTRIDVAPSVRVPLSTLTYLTVNSSAAFRSTYFTRTDIGRGVLAPEPFIRSYLDVRSDIVGPVLSKIWDPAESSRSERMKHVIEPAITVQYVSPIDPGTPVLSDSSDVVVGSSGRITYGITNRVFSRERAAGGGGGQTREILTIGIQQTYYSNADAGKYDNSYQSAFTNQRPLDLSPVAVQARLAPSALVDATARMEYDVAGGNGMQLLSAGGRLAGTHGDVSVNYSWKRTEKDRQPDNYVSASTGVRLLDGRAVGTYALSWDIAKAYIMSQGVNMTYLAQCCGVLFEYQKYNYPTIQGIPIKADRRWNVGFVLAGLGTFSNFLGAFGLGGQQ